MSVIENYHFVCLACRRSVKRPPNIPSASQMRGEKWRTPAVRCAQCDGAMLCLGRKFAAPRRRDDAGWKKLEWMIANGWRGAGWPTSPAMSQSQVREVMRQCAQTERDDWQRAQEAASFENVKRRARRNARNSRAARKRAGLELTRQRRYQDAVLARVNKPKN